MFPMPQPVPSQRAPPRPSAPPPRQVHASLAAAGIPRELFDAIVSADAFERLKPAPDIFLAAAAQLGCDLRNCVVIEDAAAGVQAARAAGMCLFSLSAACVLCRAW